jgi:hypothetical protein
VAQCSLKERDATRQTRIGFQETAIVGSGARRPAFPIGTRPPDVPCVLRLQRRSQHLLVGRGQEVSEVS